MKKIHPIIFWFISLLCGYALIISTETKIHSSEFNQNDSSSSIKLAFVGDLMCHTPQIKSAKGLDGSLNFNPTFELVKDLISSADLSFGNLETTIGDSNDSYTGYPRFRSPAEYLDGLLYAGFDFLFIANNHILDYGENGILKTIKQLKLKNFGYTGAFVNYNDYDSLRIINVNNIKLGLIAATYSTNGIPLPEGKKYLVNLINLDSLKNQINKLRALGAELIIINLHFGDEYSVKPNYYQRLVVDSLLNFGADLIIGNHPHVLQPIEIQKSISSKIDSVVIAYSLGNFISNQREFKTSIGALLFIEIEKAYRNKIKLKKVKIIPTYVFKGKINGDIQYKIIPITEDVLVNGNINFIDKTILRNVYTFSKSFFKHF